MAGGTFDKTIGKTRPGVYANFTAAEQNSSEDGTNGIVIIPLINTDYGPAGTMITITSSSTENAKALLGYSIYDDDTSGNMLLIREALKNAATVIAYICTEGTTAATGTGGGLSAEAKYKGTRGNSLTYAVIANTDGTTYDVEIYLDTTCVEKFESITSADDLSGSEYITFTANGDTLTATAGVTLSGGESATTENADVTEFLDASENVKFNTMAFPLSDSELLAAVKEKFQYFRETVGKKVQAVVSGLKADYEGIINVINGYILNSGEAITSVQATAFVAGATAGATYTQSNTYLAVEDAVEVNGALTHEKAESAIKSGNLYFSISEAGEVIIEYDINTLVTYGNGKSESYRKNRVIRVLDSFAETLALTFVPGKFNNESTGWDVMEGIGNTILMRFEDDKAIEDVDYDNDFLVDREASVGDKTYFNVGIKPVDSAEKLFFTITTR